MHVTLKKEFLDLSRFIQRLDHPLAQEQLQAFGAISARRQRCFFTAPLLLFAGRRQGMNSTFLFFHTLFFFLFIPPPSFSHHLHSSSQPAYILQTRTRSVPPLTESWNQGDIFKESTAAIRFDLHSQMVSAHGMGCPEIVMDRTFTSEILSSDVFTFALWLQI